VHLVYIKLSDIDIQVQVSEGTNLMKAAELHLDLSSAGILTLKLKGFEDYAAI